MAKMINISIAKDGQVTRKAVKAARIFEHAGLALAVHRPVTAAGNLSVKDWECSEIRTGISVIQWRAETIEDAQARARERLDSVEKLKPGAIAASVAEKLAKYGPANDPANLADAKAGPTAAECQVVIADLLDTFDSIRDNICKSMQSHRMAGNLETARLMQMTLDAIDQVVAKARPA
jgi:hypothetical protein